MSTAGERCCDIQPIFTVTAEFCLLSICMTSSLAPQALCSPLRAVAASLLQLCFGFAPFGHLLLAPLYCELAVLQSMPIPLFCFQHKPHFLHNAKFPALMFLILCRTCSSALHIQTLGYVTQCCSRVFYSHSFERSLKVTNSCFL